MRPMRILDFLVIFLNTFSERLDMDVGGFFALLAPGFAQGILHLGRYQLAAEERRLPVDHIQKRLMPEGHRLF